MIVIWLVLSALLIYGLVFALRNVVLRKTIRDYQVGLLYENGNLKKRLNAGAYWLNPLTHELLVFDTRRATSVVAGQEVTTQDNVGLKVSATVSYELSDAEKAVRSVQDYAEELYLLVQLALREEISSQPADALLENRQGLGDLLTERVAPQVQNLGVTLHSVQIRDFMFAGELKRAFNEVLKARKEGEAALERARGESAALRNLANASKMLNDNPNLLSLRLMQAIENSKGHTFGLSANLPNLPNTPKDKD